MKDAKEESSLMSIRIKVYKLGSQIPKDNNSYLTVDFYKDYFRYKGDFYADEPKDESDEKLGTKEVYHNFEFFCDKSAIVAIEKYYNNELGCWVVRVCMNGVPADLFLHYRKESEADEALKIFLVYKFYVLYADNNPIQKSL